MPESTAKTPGVPQEVPSRNTTGSLSLIGANGEGLRSWLRIVFGLGLSALLIGYVFLYSHHKSLYARVENQERHIEILNKMVEDLHTTTENARKIEKIEQQVEGIDGQIHDLSDTIKAQNADTEEPSKNAPSKR